MCVFGFQTYLIIGGSRVGFWGCIRGCRFRESTVAIEDSLVYGEQETFELATDPYPDDLT